MLEQNSLDNLDLKGYQLKEALLSDCSKTDSENEADWSMDSSYDNAP